MLNFSHSSLNIPSGISTAFNKLSDVNNVEELGLFSLLLFSILFELSFDKKTDFNGLKVERDAFLLESDVKKNRKILFISN